MDGDSGTAYLLETAKDWLARDTPGYRISDVDSFLGNVLAELRSGAPLSPADVRAVTFPLTTVHTGYAPRDVDRLVGELAQLLQSPGSGPDVPLAVRVLIDRIRHARFDTTRRGGYEEEEVDEFLDRIMRNLIRGERGTMQQLAGEPLFTRVRLRPAYVVADVDDLLGSVARTLADLAW